MPPLTPGQKFAVLDPILYWAPVNTKLVAMKKKYGETWDAPWTRIMDTMSGVAVTNRNPRIPISSEERDRIGSVRGGGGGAGSRGGGGGGGGGGRQGGGGGAGTSIGFRALTFTDDFWRFANGMSSLNVPATTEVFEFTITGTTLAAGGNATLKLQAYDGTETTHTVALATSDTPTAAATKLAGAWSPALTGWTASNPSAGVVRFTATATGPKGTHSLTLPSTGLTASAVTYVTLGVAEFDSSYVDTDKHHTIMVGFEGWARAGSLFSEDRLVRGFAYEVENTQNGSDIWGRTNADAVLQANVVLEAMPAEVTVATHLQGTGIPLSAIDKERRFNYFDTIKVA